MIRTDHARSVLLVGLKNAHAMGNQALSFLRPQRDRRVHYPDPSERLQAHVAETEGQIERLDRILCALGDSRPVDKATPLSAFGSPAAPGHVTAGDEALKTAMANHAFENHEVAAYTALITAAETDAIPLPEQSLDEGQGIAARVAQAMPSVTERFIAFQDTGETAKR